MGVSRILLQILFYTVLWSLTTGVEIENQLADIVRLEGLYQTNTVDCLRVPSDRDENSVVDEIIATVSKAKFSMATPPRVKATAYLTKAALTLPSGDIVETGTYTGGTAAIIMKTIMAFDNCDRKFWAFDSFQGLPERTIEDGQVFGAKAGAGAYKTSLAQLKYNLNKLDSWNETIIRVAKGVQFDEYMCKVSLYCITQRM